MSDVWAKAQRRLREGAQVGDPYRVVSVDDAGATLERVGARAGTRSAKPGAKSTVRVTRAKVEATAALLAAGAEIPKRGISYTSAIEAGVLFALRGSWVATDNGYKGA